MKPSRAADTPVIIAAAPNGAYKSRSDHPRLPLHPEEIANEALRCMDAGASMLHLHVRDENLNHTLDPVCYQRAIEAIRSACGDELVIQATTEAAGVYSQRAQVEAIAAIEADFLSIAPMEIAGRQSPAELDAVRKLFQTLEDRQTSVQFIIYTPGQIELLESLREFGAFSAGPVSLLFVLGRYHADRQSAPEDLSPFLESKLFSCPWMVCAFGEQELACMEFAAVSGGHARVGFENNLVGPDGKLLGTTSESVGLLRDFLKNRGLRPANCIEARKILFDPVADG